MILKQKKIRPLVNPITLSLQGKEKRDQLRKERQEQPIIEPKKQPKMMVSIPLNDDLISEKPPSKDSKRKLMVSIPKLKKPKQDLN